MFSPTPLWRYYHFRTWRVAAVDVGLAVATVLYVWWEWRTGDAGGLQYGLGAVTGIVLLRARDTLARRWDGGANE